MHNNTFQDTHEFGTVETHGQTRNDGHCYENADYFEEFEEYQAWKQFQKFQYWMKNKRNLCDGLDGQCMWQNHPFCDQHPHLDVIAARACSGTRRHG